jgi:hypothetical protein
LTFSINCILTICYIFVLQPSNYFIFFHPLLVFYLPRPICRCIVHTIMEYSLTSYNSTKPNHTISHRSSRCDGYLNFFSLKHNKPHSTKPLDELICTTISRLPSLQDFFVTVFRPFRKASQCDLTMFSTCTLFEHSPVFAQIINCSSFTSITSYVLNNTSTPQYKFFLFC